MLVPARIFNLNDGMLLDSVLRLRRLHKHGQMAICGDLKCKAQAFAYISTDLRSVQHKQITTSQQDLRVWDFQQQTRLGRQIIGRVAILPLQPQFG